MTFHQKPFLGQQINWAHPLAGGLVGCWVMNERGGTLITDLTNEFSNLTWTGTPTWKNSNKGLCLHTDYQNYLVFPKKLSDIITDKFTAHIVFMPTAQSGDGTFFAGQFSPAGYDWGFYRNDAGNTLMFFVKTGAGIAVNCCAYSLNNFYVLTGVYDGSDIYSYSEGIYANTNAQTGNVSGTHNFHLGYYYSADTHRVEIKTSLLYLWNYALSASEIAWLYREPYAMFEWSKLWYMYGAAAAGATMAGHYYRTLMQGTGY